MAGIGAAGLAGCGGGDGTATPGDGGDGSSGDGGDGSSDGTPTATPAQGDDGDGSSTDETDTATPGAEPVTNRVRVPANNTPSEFNANPWLAQDNTTGDRFLFELNGLNVVDTTDPDVALSGTTVPTPHKPGHEEVEVMTWVEDYSVDPPHDWRQTYDDRATFWNGDPYDAEALVTHNHVAWFRNGNSFSEGSTFNQEAEDQWTRHVWTNKGDVPNQEANPVATPILENDANALLYNYPMHPDFTEPYLEQYQNASSEEAVNSISSDLTSDAITLERMAENGWGSGMYEIASADDIGSERMILQLRDSDADAPHPNAEHTNVEELHVMWATQERLQVLQNEGRIDVYDGPVTPSGAVNRDSLPDEIQELTRWFNPTTGSSFLMNWQNPHLQNLWVRRAIVEAVDWNAVTNNGWGQQSARVLDHDAFLLDTEAEDTFSEEFLESLHTYSREQNLENATEYMQRAGYSRQGGQWTSPEGNTASIELTAQSGNQTYMQGSETLQTYLNDWGFEVNYSPDGFSTWSNKLSPEDSGLNYDTSIFWSDTSTVFGKYHDRGAWWGEALMGGSPTAGNSDELTADDERDTQNKPVHVEIPEEVGSIEAPDEAGINPDLENGVEVDMFEVVNAIREPGNSEEEVLELYRTCARYYNFYLPDFLFNQTVSGTSGNVRDFDWPEYDAQALDLGRNLSVADANVMTGLVQASTDTDFEPPG
jgi:hypothetical protein